MTERADTYGYPPPPPEGRDFWAFFTLAATIIFGAIAGLPLWAPQ